MSEATTRLEVRVTPGAPKDQVTGLADGVWRLKVAAPPVEGKANDRLVKYLAEVLGVPVSRVSLDRGQTGRRKVLSISGLGPEDVAARLTQAAAR